MIDKTELDDNIAELVHARDHSPQMCAKLANLYTIRRELFGDAERPDAGYSFAAMPTQRTPEPDALDDYGDSDFLIAVRGKFAADVWRIVDDLMDTLRVTNPRAYNSVMRKIREL